MTIFATILGIALVGAFGLWWAVRANGPAVLDQVDRLAGPASSVERVREARTGDHPEQRVIVYRKAGTEGPLPVLLFFHGGAWAHGSPVDYGFIARNIAPEGFVVVLGGYRLNEPGRYPAMLQDTAAAIAWVHRNIADFGGDPGRIVLSGHSAGAYNVAQVALETRWLEEQDVPEEVIKGVVGLAGPYDFYPFDKPRAKAAFESVGAGPDSQPINHARPNAPPMLLIHGEADTVVRIRNSRALERQLSEAGSPVETLYLEGKNHNDPLLALTNPWRRDPVVFDRVTRFLKAAASLSVPVQPETL